MRKWLILGATVGLLAVVACASGTTDKLRGNGPPMASSGGTGATGQNGGNNASGGSGTGQAGQGGAPATGGTGPTGSGGTAQTGGTTSVGGSGTGGTTPFVANVFLPFAVDDYYVPSGFMGREDTTTATTIKEIDGITMDPKSCPSGAAGAGGAGGAGGAAGGGLVGKCWKVTYIPQMLDPNATPPSTWAGVYWQSPERNWGDSQGQAVQAGATKITFTAWSAKDGQDVEFLAGGIGGLGTTYSDDFKVQKVVTLTTTPTQYNLDLSLSTYQYVLGGFGWVISATSTDPITFYVKNIQWVK